MDHYQFLEQFIRDMRAKYVLDIGTNNGGSAIAMWKGGAKVLTFEVNPNIGEQVKAYPDIDLRYQNLLEDASEVDWEKVDFIFLDVDPHDGLQEPKFIELFEQKLPKDKTIWVLLDDITINGNMRKFYESTKLRDGWKLTEIELTNRAMALGTYN